VLAILTAEDHSDSGMRERTLRVFRQRSKRWRVRSSLAGSSGVVFRVLIGCPPHVRDSTTNDTRRLKTVHTRLPEGHATPDRIG